ncbi:MAG: carboxymuconolactone decarboxylase family protein [Caldilineaceae bacterium]|nr:carboxymuconolactone decarboxylase family protein [Caldilineaceae bacterium]
MNGEKHSPSDTYEAGIVQFAQMVGDERIEALRQRFRDVSPEFEHAVMSIIGGQIWNRPGLDLRTRSLVSIATLAAQGRVNALSLNIEMALNNGATEAEIVETFFQVAIYAGFAAAWDGLEKAKPLFEAFRTRAAAQQ